MSKVTLLHKWVAVASLSPVSSPPIPPIVCNFWCYIMELLLACYSAAFSEDNRRYEKVVLAYRGYTLQPEARDIVSPLVRYAVRRRGGEWFVVKRINRDAPHEARLLRLLSTQALHSDRNHTAFPVEMVWGDRIVITPLYHRPCDFSLTPNEVLNAAKQLTEGVAFLHSHRIAHLDINWANILVAKPPSPSRPRYLLTDFEMSGVYTEERPRICIWWKEGRVTLPPEGIYDIDPFGFDVWSLGVALQVDLDVAENYPGFVWPVTLTKVLESMVEVPAKRPTASVASRELESIDVDKPLAYD
ncbi:hypothetical protein FRB99_001018, partial [Tulasnella sp. 403]